MRILWAGKGRHFRFLEDRVLSRVPWTDGVGLGTEPSGKVDDLHWGEGRLRRDEKLGVWGHVYFLLT